MKNIIKLIISIIICQLVGVIGSIFTAPAIYSWYQNLIKPSFNPPNWIFGPVWVALFLLMGISLYLVWKKGIAKKETKIAVAVFAFQLFLNIFWSFIFFNQKYPLAAFIEIISLFTAILATILAFYKISKTAALLLLPYILWVSFAAVLNFFLWRMNL